MKIPGPETLRAYLERERNDVHFVRVTEDRRIATYSTTKDAFSDSIAPLSMLMVHLCVSGGGPLRHASNLVQIEQQISPGAIGVIPPGAKGRGHWPQMTAISIAISGELVAESFGASWTEKLKSRVMSQIFQDPLVEAIMRDIGDRRAQGLSDAELQYAALMIAHRLLDAEFKSEVSEPGGVPLSGSTMDRINLLLDRNMDRPVSVSEMAEIAGISRHHFSRRFKATTGFSPLQYSIRRKLNYAASLLERGSAVEITSVAQDVGFTNTSHFTRAFRKYFGLSPSLWRTQQLRSEGMTTSSETAIAWIAK